MHFIFRQVLLCFFFFSEALNTQAAVSNTQTALISQPLWVFWQVIRAVEELRLLQARSLQRWGEKGGKKGGLSACEPWEETLGYLLNLPSYNRDYNKPWNKDPYETSSAMASKRGSMWPQIYWVFLR